MKNNMWIRKELSTKWLLAVCVAILVLLTGLTSVTFAANKIKTENALPGTPASQWDIAGGGHGDESIQGFTTNISVNLGQAVQFKVDTEAANWRLDIYRMGYYGGNGARLVTTIGALGSQNQPACLEDSNTGLTDCGNWHVSTTWTVPANATSGIYFAKAVRADTGGASHIFFIVRDDAGHSDVLFQVSDTSWQAYNTYSANFYGCNANFDSTCRAFKISYNRPFWTRSFEPQTWVFNAEYPMVRWLEANGYDVSYFTDTDSDRNGSLIQTHKVYMSNGHDEYWSGNQRANVQAARDAGVNLAFFSGNKVYWKTRWENSVDGSGTPYRTLVCYKETWANAVIDPADPPTWTGTWRDPRFSPPADGGRPENDLSGTICRIAGNYNGAITVPAADGKMRFWRNTSIANLSPGQTVTLVPGSLGEELDGDEDNGFRPPGLFHLTTTTAFSPDSYLLDYGTTVGPGTMIHNLTLYRHASGALVFSAGTYDWSWGLDNHHDRSNLGTQTNVAMQQATVNLLADMNTQPDSTATLLPGLNRATASIDVTAPSSTITSPSTGAVFTVGSSVTITGTAFDGSGVIGGVEVSVDGGASWHPAQNRENWSYTWVPNNAGPAAILSRAVDDSGNLETPFGAVDVTVEDYSLPSGAVSIWNPSFVPSQAAVSDGQPIELGVKIRADVNGYITGVRFYKGAANTGQHVGSLWTSTGTLLASATFTNETASGWQNVLFAAPVAIQANTTYVASYHSASGYFALDEGYFGVDDYNPPLRALANGQDGGNGVYKYGASGFPTQTANSNNYWVDVIFEVSQVGSDTTPPTVTGFTVPATAASLIVPITSFTATDNVGVTGYMVNESSTAPLPTASGWSAVGPTAYTVASAGSKTLYAWAKDAAGNVSASRSASVVVTSSQTTQYSIWTATSTPSQAAVTDGQPLELGVKFQADIIGYITGLRFYKGAANTGVHVANLWTGTGALLATATFTNETASGWQQVLFAAPVAIQANTTYVASYYSASGYFALNEGYFVADIYNPPLRALANGANGGNGVYKYGASGFPNQTWNSNNYWVDVVFSPTGTTGGDTTPPTVTAFSVPATATSLTVSITSFTATDNVGVTGYLVNESSAAPLATAGGWSATVPTSYTFSTAGSKTLYAWAKDAAGNVSASRSAPVVVSSSQTTQYSIWAATSVPNLAAVTDGQPLELGMKFQADTNGYITGLRFYKGAANTGVHVANLWTGTGALLATATFTNETASGWQQVLFATPVAIQANTTYIASYHSASGYFALDEGYFVVANYNPPLRALANGTDGGNGVYIYGASGFPTQTWNSNNYWVDVVFQP